jgi:hypothetical protein
MAYTGEGGYDEHKLQDLPPGGTVSIEPDAEFNAC